MSMELLGEMVALMGTHIEIKVAVDVRDLPLARLALSESWDWLRSVAERMTRFDERSELSSLNRSAGAWRVVTPDLFAVIELSLMAARATGGLFDPALLPWIEAAGYDRDFAAIAHRDLEPEWQVPRRPQPAPWEAIAIDKAGCRVRLPEGARLDLGGIVKGWAADQILVRQLADFPNVLVSVGGDLRVRGTDENQDRWAIAIGDTRHGATQAHAAIITMTSGGLATSGATDRWWWRGGVREHHLIDPRTGRPVQLWIDPEDDHAATPFPLIASATAIAPSAAQAEVAAKVALLHGYPMALGESETAWNQREPGAHDDRFETGNQALLLLLGMGEITISRHLRDYLATTAGGGDVWLMLPEPGEASAC